MKLLRTEMSKVLFLFIIIILIVFLIHNFWSSTKEIINLISTFFIRLHKRKRIDYICKAEHHFTNIINSKIINQHITYINLNFNLIQKNAEHSDEENDEAEMNDNKNQMISNPKKVNLLPESSDSNQKEIIMKRKESERAMSE